MADVPTAEEVPTVEVLFEQEVELPASPGEKPKRGIARYVRTTEAQHLRDILPEGVQI